MIVAATIAGCPVSQSVALYNNGGSDVIVMLASRNVSWPVGSELLIGDNKVVGWDSLRWVGDPNTKYVPQLTFCLEEACRTFQLIFSDAPKKYIGGSAGSIEYYLQLEKGNDLYLVMPGKERPIIGDVTAMMQLEPLPSVKN